MASIASSTKHDGFMEPSNRFLIPPGSYAPAVVWAPGSPDHVKQNLAEEEEQKKAGEVKVDEETSAEDDFYFEMGRVGKDNYFPAHFMRGTLISVDNDKEKTVDQLSSDDFLMSSVLSTDLNMETCAVVEIVQVYECSRITFMVPSKNKEVLSSVNLLQGEVQVLLEVQNEYPFFALGKGWTSCNPRGTLKTFGLSAKTLKIGDICITLVTDEKLKGTMGTASVPDAILDRKRVLPQILGIEDGRRSAPPLGYTLQVRTRTWSGSGSAPLSVACPHST